MGLPATATAGVVRGGRHAAGGHPAPEASREVSLNVVPKNVEILVDGRSRGSWVPGAPLVVGPGKHTLEFRHEPFCFPVSVELPAEARAIPDVRLPWRRGYLTVRTVPAAAELVVKQPHRERVTARPGVPLAIPIPEESPNGQERVRVTAVADGYPTREVEIEVTAGMHADRTIDLTAR